MSIKRMSAVWDLSVNKGNDLLLLLAIADCANDLGFAWPGIEYLMTKTRLSKATVIRRTAALEKSGELYAAHDRRNGNKYIVLPGLTTDDLKDCLAAHLNMDAATISVNLPLIEKRRSKYQIATSEVSQLDTSEVSQLDTSEVSPVIHDPLYIRQGIRQRNISPASDDEAVTRAAATATPEQQDTPEPTTTPTPVQETTTVKTRKRDLLFDAVAETLFAVPAGGSPNGQAGRIAKARKALALGEVMPDELRTAAAWWLQAHPGCSLPKDGEKAVGMVMEWRATQATQGQRKYFHVEET